MRAARSLAAAIVLLVAGTIPASAQDIEPIGTPPPDLFPGALISINVNRLDDARINELIRDSTRDAANSVNARMKRLRYTPGLRTPQSVSTAARDWADEGYDASIVSGGLQSQTIVWAQRFPDTVFLDFSQAPPCVTSDGRPDPSGTCEGGDNVLPRNYMAISFAEDEAGYLAGIIAAAAATNRRLGIIGGTPTCSVCNRYIQGFELGARWLRPDIEIETAYISDTDAEVGFADRATAELFAGAFIDVHQPDVLLVAARSNNRAINRVACDRDVLLVGVDLDLAASQPRVAGCVLTSATKPIADAVRDAIFDWTSERLERVKRYDIGNDGVAITDEWERNVTGLPVDLPVRLDQARDEIITGIATTCPEYCGRPAPPEVAEDEADESP